MPISRAQYNAASCVGYGVWWLTCLVILLDLLVLGVDAWGHAWAAAGGWVHGRGGGQGGAEAVQRWALLVRQAVRVGHDAKQLAATGRVGQAEQRRVHPAWRTGGKRRTWKGLARPDTGT